MLSLLRTWQGDAGKAEGTEYLNRLCIEAARASQLCLCYIHKPGSNETLFRDRILVTSIVIADLILDVG